MFFVDENPVDNKNNGANAQDASYLSDSDSDVEMLQGIVADGDNTDSE